MASYRIVEQKKPELKADGSADCHYYVQRRFWIFGWCDETYADAVGGDLPLARKYWFDSFEAAWLHIFKKPTKTHVIETIIAQYLNV